MGGFYRGAYASPLKRPQLADAFDPDSDAIIRRAMVDPAFAASLGTSENWEGAILDLHPVRTLTRLTSRGRAAPRLHLREQAQMYRQLIRHQPGARHSQPDPELTPCPILKRRLPEETI
jgi:hypothetical protein